MTSRREAEKPLHRQRDFLCLWWVGVASFVVRWLEILVFGVFTYNETGSALLTAMMTMVRLLPMALFGAVIGVLAERVVRRNALILIVSVLLVTSVVLMIIALSGHLQVWHLAIGAFVNGAAWATESPVRRTMIGEVAGADRISQAMSIEVGTSNATRMAGPSLGGFLLWWAGIQGTFVFAVGLYASALLLALAVRYRNAPADRDGQPSVLRSLIDGFAVMSRDRRLVGCLWLTVLFNLFAWPVLSMVPVIGKDQLGLAANGVGLLSSVDGLGALVGAIVVSRVSTPARYGIIYALGIVLFLTMVPVFALTTSPLIAALAMFLVGAGQASFAVMQSTITLVTAPAGMRSQAMGLMTMCIGTGPFGFLMIGLLADRLGAPTTAAIMGGLGLAVMAATWPWWRATWAMEYARPASL